MEWRSPFTAAGMEKGQGPGRNGKKHSGEKTPSSTVARDTKKKPNKQKENEKECPLGIAQSSILFVHLSVNVICAPAGVGQNLNQSEATRSDNASEGSIAFGFEPTSTFVPFLAAWTIWRPTAESVFTSRKIRLVRLPIDS
jgi:hypothetical protein